jgi:transposase-like protein
MKKPPFCPNHRCRYHRKPDSSVSWYLRRGFYSTRSLTRIQRYQCRDCRSFFSSRTFSIDYFSKRSLDYHRLLTYLVSGMSIRAMARACSCSPNTIANKLSRLSRQVLAFTENISSSINLREDLVADGFESFVVSQYFPNNFTLLVGQDSQFVYSLTYAQLRRKGAMTEHQAHRALYYRMRYPLPRNQITRSFSRLASKAAELLTRSTLTDHLILYTDEKREYRKPVADLRDAGLPVAGVKRIVHVRTRATEPRTKENPLYAVNYLDREIRKDQAEHHRETVCFARNVNASLERMELYLFHHNFIKPYRVNRRDCVYESHACAGGIDGAEIRKGMYQVFTRRVFLSTERLGYHAERVWRHAYPTPKKFLCDYLPAYVFA